MSDAGSAVSRSARRLRRATVILVGAGLLCVLAVFAPPALGAQVTLYAASSATGNGTCADASDACTLPTAVTRINGGDWDGFDVRIDVAAGTYALSASEVLNAGSPSSVTFAGAGAASTIVNGQSANEPFDIEENSYNVTIEKLTLENGSSASNLGTDLYADTDDRTVTLDDDLINGGTNSSGELITALVGVMSGTADIEDSTVENGAGSSTSGVAAGGGTLDIEDSTIYKNAGAGVVVSGTATRISSSTIVDNEDAIMAISSSVDVIGSTIDGNGVGLESSSGVVALAGDILGYNDNEDCEGTAYTDDGHNVANDTTCGFGTSSQQGVLKSAIGLGSLGGNGGPTQTEAIGASSAAHDVVPVSASGLLAGFCAGSDQRGSGRLQVGGAGSSCDAGAYAYTTSAAPTLSSVSPSSAEPGASVTLSGANLGYETTVSFGSGNVAGTITAQSPTQITVTVPSLASGSQPIIATNPDGSATIAFTVLSQSVPPTPTSTPPSVSILTSSIKLKGKGSRQVELSCSAAACSGEITLTTKTHKKVRKHHKTVLETVTVELGSASYDLAAGTSGTSTLILTSAGHADAKTAAKHHLQGKLHVTVNGGTTTNTGVTVS